jgi:hypothetical protein
MEVALFFSATTRHLPFRITLLTLTHIPPSHHHFTTPPQITFRILTAVGLFLAVTKWGFVLIFVSFSIRVLVGARCGSEDNRLTMPRSLVTGITLAGLKCGLDHVDVDDGSPFEWVSANVFFCFLLNCCDAAVALTLLFAVQGDTGVDARHNLFVACTLGVTFVAQLVLIVDRYQCFFLNPFVQSQETNIIKCVKSMAWLLECLNDELDKEEQLKHRKEKGLELELKLGVEGKTLMDVSAAGVSAVEVPTSPLESREFTFDDMADECDSVWDREEEENDHRRQDKEVELAPTFPTSVGAGEAAADVSV